MIPLRAARCCFTPAITVRLTSARETEVHSHEQANTAAGSRLERRQLLRGPGCDFSKMTEAVCGPGMRYQLLSVNHSDA